MSARQRPAVTLALSLGLTAALAGLSGCADPAPLVMDPALEVEAQPVQGALSLTCDGWIDNRAPVAYSPTLSWMPFARVVPDGAQVAVGDILAEHDVTMLRQWIADQQREQEQLAAEQERSRLDLARQLDELEQAAVDAASDRSVRVAKLAADASDAEAQQRIAALALAVARSAATRAAERAPAAAALVAADRLPRTDLASAEAARDRAQRALVAAEEDAAAWLGTGSKALARRQLEISLQRAERELTGLASVGERLEVVRAAGAAVLDEASFQLRWVEQQLAQRRTFAAAPFITSTTAGTVRLKNRDVRRGGKPPNTPCLFVLASGQTVAYIRIPEAQRDLCTVWTAARPEDGRATVTIPAAGAVLGARVASIGATAENRPEGGRAFIAVLVFDEESWPQAVNLLKPGMRLSAELECTEKPLAIVPAWAVQVGEDPREPFATLSDGTRRQVRGVRLAHGFVATAGLAPGERLRALAQDDQQRTTAQRPKRLTGVLEPVDALPVRIASLHWDLVEVVPDGSRVEQGQVLARMTKTAWWIDTDRAHWNMEAGRLQADAKRRSERLQAGRELLDRSKAWRDADLDRAEARLKILSDGAAERERAWREAEGERVLATAAAGEAAAQARAAADPRVAPSLSRNQQEDRRLAELRTTAAADNAALKAAAARWPDLLGLFERSTAYSTALDKAEDARIQWHLARLQHGQACDRAERTWRRKLDELQREGQELEDEVVLAPVSGRVFHRNSWPWRPGDGVWTNEPFRMVADPPPGGSVRRRLRLEPQAHRAGTWRQDAEIPVVVPGVGTFPGRVVQVATWYGLSTVGRLEAEAGGGSTTVDEQVFNLVIDITVSLDQADRVLPGMTAYVD